MKPFGRFLHCIGFKHKWEEAEWYESVFTYEGIERTGRMIFYVSGERCVRCSEKRNGKATSMRRFGP